MPQGYKTCRNSECGKLTPSVSKYCRYCKFNFNGPSHYEQRVAAQQIQASEEFDKKTAVADLYPLKSHSKEQLELLANAEWSKGLANVVDFLRNYGNDADQLIRTAKRFNNDYEQISLAARSLLNCQLS